MTNSAKTAKVIGQIGEPKSGSDQSAKNVVKEQDSNELILQLLAR